MTTHQSPSPLAGKTVKVHLKGYEFVDKIRVEDWWDRVSGDTWARCGAIAAQLYGARVARYGLPRDNEVLYGKHDSLGYLFNVAEIVSDQHTDTEENNVCVHTERELVSR